MTMLHRIGDALREGLAGVPLGAVRLIMLSGLALLLIWVLRLPAERVTPRHGTGRRGENLRLPAALAIVIQLIVYSLL